MQGDTAIAVGGPRKQGLREVAGEVLGGIESAFGRSQDRDRDRRESPILQEPLMGRGVVGLEEGLMALLECRRHAGQRELVVVEPPLNVEVRFHPVQVAFALRAYNSFMADLQPGTDRLKLVGGIGAATV
jgi:hypothetical protein